MRQAGQKGSQEQSSGCHDRILREAGGRPVMRSRGRPDSTGNVKKADLLRMRAVERMNRLGGRLQQDRTALFRKIRLSFRR